MVDLYKGAVAERYAPSDAELWDALQAVHERAVATLCEFEYEVVCEVVAKTAGGSELTFDDVSVARDSLERAGERPASVWAYAYLHKPSDVLKHLWGSPLRVGVRGDFRYVWPGGTNLSVETIGFDQVQADGVGAALTKFTARYGLDEAPSAAPGPTRRAYIGALFANPWVIGIGVGIFGTVIGGLILAWLGGLWA